MNDLLDDITGLVGIFLLPEPDDSTEGVSNKSFEDEDSEENVNSILCHTDTFFFHHCIHMDTFFFPYCIIMT